MIAKECGRKTLGWVLGFALAGVLATGPAQAQQKSRSLFGGRHDASAANVSALFDGRVVALRTVRIRAGKIKSAEHARQVLPFDEPVYRSPAGDGRRQVHAGAARGAIEPAGGEEQRIAELLEVQAPAILPGQQAILRVHGRQPRIARAGLLVGVR